MNRKRAKALRKEIREMMEHLNKGTEVEKEIGPNGEDRHVLFSARRLYRDAKRAANKRK